MLEVCEWGEGRVFRAGARACTCERVTWRTKPDAGEMKAWGVGGGRGVYQTNQS